MQQQQQLVDWLSRRSTSRSRWRIGDQRQEWGLDVDVGAAAVVTVVVVVVVDVAESLSCFSVCCGWMWLWVGGGSSFLWWWKREERKLFLRAGGLVRPRESVEEVDETDEVEETRSLSGGGVVAIFDSGAGDRAGGRGARW